MKRISLIAAVTLFLSACGTTNNYLAEKTKTVEYYRIFDIKTSSATRLSVAKAASDGLGRNVNNANEATPLPSSGDLPENPGRFKLVNPFDGTKFAAMASAFGGTGGVGGFRMATCDGAVWTATAERSARSDSNLRLTACIFQYKDGYHLDLYAVFTKKEGGLTQIGRDMAHAMVGTPEEWTEKTFLDIVRNVRSVTGANITLLEAQPEVVGTPWLDNVDAPSK